MPSALEAISENIWIQRFPLSLLGAQLGRVVTVIRLTSGKLIIHSTASFSTEDIEQIRALGDPEWLVEATKLHDTYSAAGCAAFSELTYLTPPDFSAPKGVQNSNILPAPDAWSGEIEVIRVAGMPKFNEHVFFHSKSKTLIIADLLFNIPPSTTKWTKLLLRVVSGIRKYPGMSRLFRFGIKDKDEFKKSLSHLANLDFENLIVAHGDPIIGGAKAVFLSALEEAGFPVS